MMVAMVQCPVVHWHVICHTTPVPSKNLPSVPRRGRSPNVSASDVPRGFLYPFPTLAFPKNAQESGNLFVMDYLMESSGAFLGDTACNCNHQTIKRKHLAFVTSTYAACRKTCNLLGKKRRNADTRPSCFGRMARCASSGLASAFDGPAMTIRLFL